MEEIGAKKKYIFENKDRFANYFSWRDKFLAETSSAYNQSRQSDYDSGLAYYQTKDEVVWDAYGSKSTRDDTAFENEYIDHDDGSFNEFINSNDDYVVQCAVNEEFNSHISPKISREWIDNEFRARGFDHILGSDINTMIDTAIEFSIKAVDVYAPYTLLTGLGDVVFTDEYRYFQYRVLSQTTNGLSKTELNPEGIETFRYEPGLGRQNWEAHYKRGRMALFLEEALDVMNEFVSEDVSYFVENNAEIQGETYEIEGWVKLALDYDSIFWEMLEIGVWAGIMWMTHPDNKESRNWREYHHPVYSEVYESLKRTHKIDGNKIHASEMGTALFHEWNLYNTGEFERIPRPPMSCSHCGIVEHCIQLIDCGGGDAKFVCEGCYSDDTPFAGRICGTRMCDQASCFHHPAYGLSKEEKEAFKLKFHNALTRSYELRRFGALEKSIGHDGRLQIGRKYDGFIEINRQQIENHHASIAETVAQMYQLEFNG